jgi:histidinol-phosphate/aromatic aminotransferase/cobyric acid decarboxylase-like protein
MIKREAYKQRNYGLSTQNEPGEDTYLTTNVRLYPDMYYAYKKFGEFFNLQPDTFFLGNGCENTMKNVLLALKPKTLCWAGPTWRMLEVYCEALDIKPIYKQFIYNKADNSFETPIDFYNTKADILYSNCGVTTCFEYTCPIKDLNESAAKYNICDITYQNIDCMKQSIEILLKNPKNIIVGSFDKLIGCGLRLGFAIYPKSLHHKMSLQREQYINSLAFSWLINTDFDIDKPRYKEELIQMTSSIDYVTDNFITLYGDVISTIPCHKFVVDNHTFTRFGMPNNQTEFEALKLIITDFIHDRLYNK